MIPSVGRGEFAPTPGRLSTDRRHCRAGTVNTGGHRSLADIADVASDTASGCTWMALWAPAILSTQYREQLPHWLVPTVWPWIHTNGFTSPWKRAGAGADAQAMRPAFVSCRRTANGRQSPGVGGLPWLSEYVFQQTRASAPSKSGWPKHHGTDGYRRALNTTSSWQGLAEALRP